LTDNIAGKVTSFVSYDDWGALTSKAIVRVGVRELDLVQEYTGHPADIVLGLYYAKARMYDPLTSRFISSDLIKGFIAIPQTLNPYVYCINNPRKYIDPLGLFGEIDNYGNLIITPSMQAEFMANASASRYVPYKPIIEGMWTAADTIRYTLHILIWGYSSPYDNEAVRQYYITQAFKPTELDYEYKINETALENRYIDWLVYDQGFLTSEQLAQQKNWNGQFIIDLAIIYAAAVSATVGAYYFTFQLCTTITAVAEATIVVGNSIFKISGAAASWFTQKMSEIMWPTLVTTEGFTVDRAVALVEKIDESILVKALEEMSNLAKMIDPDKINQVFSIVQNNSGSGSNSNIPIDARTTTNEQEIFKRLEKFHGIDPHVASKRLHKIKQLSGRGGADNVIFDMTGNVYSKSGEWIGSLTQP